MKTNIKTLLDSFVHDNEQNGGNVAEYIMADTAAEDNGYFWFLTESEITEFENDQKQRAELKEEIFNYVQENYNYNLKAERLIEKWIVVDSGADTEDRLKVTRRDNFEDMLFCRAYSGDYGQLVNCNNAGCYVFLNSESPIHGDFIYDVEKKFDIKLSSYFNERHGMTFDTIETFIGMIEELNEDTENHEDFNYTIIDVVELKKFAETWKEKNEIHTEVKGWTFHDSHNFKTIILETEFGEADCNEVDELEQINILLQMPEKAPYMDGFNTSEESEDYYFHFDRWATNPWFCFVEKK